MILGTDGFPADQRPGDGPTARRSTPCRAEPPGAWSPLRLGGLTALAAGTGWLLVRLGDTPVGIPLASRTELIGWLVDTDPAVLAAALVRLAALGLCAYLVVTLVVAWVAVAAGSGRVAGMAVRLLPSYLRRVVVGSAGLGLVTSTMVPSLAAAHPVALAGDSEPGADPTAVMVKLDPEDPASGPAGAPGSGAPPTAGGSSPTVAPETSSVPTTADPGTPRPTEAPDGGPAPTGAVPGAEEAATSPSPPDPGTPSGPDPTDVGATGPGSADDDPTWTVEPGDSLWSIAEQTLRGAHDAAEPTEAEVARYWRRLIAANRSRLAAPAQPDLIFPGQKFLLPEP